MLKNVLNKITAELRSNGVENVYSCFDTIPISSKGNDIFTIVGIEGLESSSPIFSPSTVFLPFKAEVSVSAAAPKSFTMAQLYTYCDENIIPVIKNIASLSCSIRNLSIKPDSSINKLTLKIKIQVSGIHRFARGET